MSITGGCYCGAIRFRVEKKPMHQANCHCANCRRAVGGQAVAWITVASSGLLWEQGTPQRYRTDTGAWRTFCGACGTSLSYKMIPGLTKSISRPAVSTERKIFREP
ncbi:MAG: GFA family protein [Chthoniobacterales bacterium]